MNETTIEQVLGELVRTLAHYGLDMVAAIIILIVGWSVASWAKTVIRNRFGQRKRVDLTLVSFLASFVKYVIIIVTLIAVLSQFGVQTTSLITVLGAAGLAIGLALQGTLSNVAAGVMLLLFRPFRVGDVVEVQGAAGTVRDVSLFVTEITTADNILITVPNGQIWGNAVRNLSINPTRRIELTVGISYDDDLDKAFAAILAVIAAEPRALKNPAPLVALNNLGASTLDLVIRVWTRTPENAAVRFDLLKAIKERLDAEGIEMPYPQQVTHVRPAPALSPDNGV